MHCVVRAVLGINSAYDMYILVRTPRASGHLSRVGNFIPLPSYSVVYCAEGSSGRNPPPSVRYFLGSTARALFGNYEV